VHAHPHIVLFRVIYRQVCERVTEWLAVMNPVENMEHIILNIPLDVNIDNFATC